MERLNALYPGETLKVLTKTDTELLLLVGNRHIKYEKTNLCFLNGLKFTNKDSILDKSIAANIVRKSYHPFYSTDIEEIIQHADHWSVIVKSDIAIHYGSFTIYKE